MNKQRITLIKNLLEQHYNEIEIAKQIGITKQGVNYLIRKYLPELTKQNRKLQKLPFQRLTDLQKAQHARFQRKRIHARRANIEFTIQQNEIIYPTQCPILGLELDYYASQRQENSASFDRFDPKIGYTKENTQIISWRANRIKNDGTEEEHFKIAYYLLKGGLQKTE